ncbi:hypothetical protein HRG84_11085 [Flavisolibacter sp. BT320]|nr:hypothetical protein [Flavisolibacter longurius]
MKTILSLAICAVCYACFPAKEVQAEMVYATLVKVEEVNRYPNLRQKIFTWQTEKDVSFVTYEKPSVNIPIGTQTRVLMTK